MDDGTYCAGQACAGREHCFSQKASHRAFGSNLWRLCSWLSGLLPFRAATAECLAELIAGSP